jgi:hypothetical protein
MMDLKIILLTPAALLVQIYDTKTGRRSSAVSPYTAVPFPNRTSPAVTVETV